VEFLYRPVRVDLLMYQRTFQSRPAGLSDFFVTLYSDDGSSTHNPGVQVRVCARVDTAVNTASTSIPNARAY
jgi:hypothetical protein